MAKGDSQVHHALQAWTGICSALLLLLLLIYSIKERAVPQLFPRFKGFKVFFIARD
jgi:hypothetical protein